ncbi:MAG: hypothetical protein JXR46_09770 [Calditrichaceae bacterium]|nr:hypothetical protein [Calditrichaceae bacterium]MBN2709321.1 hypothetical protein [Calditrichaceae bacterium]RQV94656.1 MAG: hypothetical protein EH224_09550 [Calditrichota bacterium]
MNKIYIIIFFTILLVILIMMFTGTTIVLSVDEPEKNVENFKKGDTLDILGKFNFNEGDWCAYLVLSRSDYTNLNNLLPKRNCLKLEDKDLMNRMKQEWKMKYTEGDVATVESYIVFYKNGKAIFKSGIVLDQNKEGFQSSSFGWIEPITKNIIVKYCKEFKPVYWPILIL